MSRNVNVASISFVAKTFETIEDTLQAVEHKIDVVAGGMDLVVLPEAFIHFCGQCRKSSYGAFDFAEPLDGPTVHRMAQRARQHNCYLTVPMILNHDGAKYNSIVLLDRGGEVAAVYDKVYPTVAEMAVGREIMPGKGAVTVDTDFGRVGFAICFDLNFQELQMAYQQQGAELLVFSSMYHGGMGAQTWAFLNHCYLLSSISGDSSRIIDPLGRVLNEAWLLEGGLMTHRINLDYVVLHSSRNILKFEELRRRFGSQIRLEHHSREAISLLYSCSPDLSVQEICSALELETSDGLFQRALAGRKQRMESGPLPPPPKEW